MDGKKFLPLAISVAMILAGIIGLIGFIKGLALQKVVQICNVNSTCTTNDSITGAVVGALQTGGIITGIAALFVLFLGVIILINSMRSRND